MKLRELKNTGNNKLGRIYNKISRMLDDDFINHPCYMTDEMEKNYREAFNDMDINDILTYFGEKKLLRARGFGKESLRIMKELSVK